MPERIEAPKSNWIIPGFIHAEAMLALSRFPELFETRIKFVCKSLRTTMAAQPSLANIFRKKKNRIYIIFINDDPDKARGVSLKEMPPEALVGIIGHELVHIEEYTRYSNLIITLLGIKYLFSTSFKRRFERDTDMECIKRGLGKYLLAYQEYVEENANIAASYKYNLKKFYMNKEEIKSFL